MRYLHHHESPLGAITLAASDDGLTGLWFDGQRHDRAGVDTNARERETAVLVQATHWLDAYFAGHDLGFVPPLDLMGTPFQRAVWELLLELAYGQTTTYGALAQALGKRTGRHTSARAVGGAVGRNRISLIVPCHRVLGADGSLTGYAGGAWRKERLLRLEGIHQAHDSDAPRGSSAGIHRVLQRPKRQENYA